MRIGIMILVLMVSMGLASATWYQAYQDYTMLDTKSPTVTDYLGADGFTTTVLPTDTGVNFQTVGSLDRVEYGSGIEQNLWKDGVAIGKSSIDNDQITYFREGMPNAGPTTSATQSGYTLMTLNNAPDPGNPMNTIKDFQFDSGVEGNTVIDSEGALFAVSKVASTTTGAASRDTLTGLGALGLGDGILLHDVEFTDTDGAEMWAHGIKSVDDTALYTTKVTHADFSYEATSGANVVLQDSMVEHADVFSGMKAGSYAEAKLNPELNGFKHGILETGGTFGQVGELKIDSFTDWEYDATPTP